MPRPAAAQRSWLTTILKHKFGDLLRQRAGTGPPNSCCADLQRAASVPSRATAALTHQGRVEDCQSR